MLHTTPIDKITYEDIVAFCAAGHPEGLVLEYKGQLPSNKDLAETVAALANTHGGLLIVGINAPAGKPTPPFEGIVFDEKTKYEEMIESLILSRVKEPIFPEIQVCKNGDKAFIVIRVAESHFAPHRVVDNSKIYVRTGQSSRPNDLASWDRIEWLITRRKKSEELRGLLIEEGERYFVGACKSRALDVTDKSHYYANFSLRAVPLYPRTPMISFRLLDAVAIIIRKSSNGVFPRLDNAQPIQNGLHRLYIARDDDKDANGKDFLYTRIDTFGQYLVKGNLATPSERSFRFSWLIARLKRFLASSCVYYRELGIHGTIQVSIQLTNAFGINMIPSTDGDYVVVPSDSITWERTIDLLNLKTDMNTVLVEMVSDMAWSLGIRDLSDDDIEKNLAAL